MIIYINACDHCGSQKEINLTTLQDEDDRHCGIEVAIKIEDVKNTAKSGMRYGGNTVSVTFCDREWLLAYLNENLDKACFDDSNYSFLSILVGYFHCFWGL